MRAAVITFPGSNRDHDMVVALEKISGRRPLLIWYTERDLPPVDLIVLPGGFSYGDYLRSGAIAARAPIMRTVFARAESGVPVLGVCNGFQILCEVGILPGVLMRNASLRFICKTVNIRVDATDTILTRGYRQGAVLRVPVAHGDGNYRCDDETLRRLHGENRVAFRYVDADGQATPAANINGSIDNIAGILCEKRITLGLMPHPENMIEDAHGGRDGRALFEGAMELLQPA
jgi:phosphoribosylformylglycinamidine synthase